jgi:hypothetical protein
MPFTEPSSSLSSHPELFAQQKQNTEELNQPLKDSMTLQGNSFDSAVHKVVDTRKRGRGERWLVAFVDKLEAILPEALEGRKDNASRQLRRTGVADNNNLEALLKWYRACGPMSDYHFARLQGFPVDEEVLVVAKTQVTEKARL